LNGGLALITGLIGLTLPCATYRLTAGLPAELQVVKNANGTISLEGATKTNDFALVILTYFSVEKLPISVVIVENDQDRMSIAKDARRRVNKSVCRLSEWPRTRQKRMCVIGNSIHKG